MCSHRGASRASTFTMAAEREQISEANRTRSELLRSSAGKCDSTVADCSTLELPEERKSDRQKYIRVTHNYRKVPSISP